MKKTLIAGAAVAAIGLAAVTGVGLASANSTSDGNSLIDKIATKFNLNRDEVAKVFAENRTERQAQMEAKQAERLDAAVKDGKLTQAQADYIKKARADIKALMDKVEPGKADDATRQALRDKMEALRQWAKDNHVDMRYVGGGFRHGMGHGPGMGMGMHDGMGMPHDMDSQPSSN